MKSKYIVKWITIIFSTYQSWNTDNIWVWQSILSEDLFAVLCSGFEDWFLIIFAVLTSMTAICGDLILIFFIIFVVDWFLIIFAVLTPMTAICGAPPGELRPIELQPRQHWGSLRAQDFPNLLINNYPSQQNQLSLSLE